MGGPQHQSKPGVGMDTCIPPPASAVLASRWPAAAQRSLPLFLARWSSLLSCSGRDQAGKRVGRAAERPGGPSGWANRTGEQADQPGCWRAERAGRRPSEPGRRASGQACEADRRTEQFTVMLRTRPGGLRTRAGPGGRAGEPGGRTGERASRAGGRGAREQADQRAGRIVVWSSLPSCSGRDRASERVGRAGMPDRSQKHIP